MDKVDEVMRVIATGLGISLQDRGRHDWRRFGVPASGPIDPHAAECANHLLDNTTGAPVLELLGQGAKIEMLQDAWIAICGAASECSVPLWQAVHAPQGTVIKIDHCAAGLWTYLAVEAGFAAAPVLGSVSYYARGALGYKIEAGSALRKNSGTRFTLARGVRSRLATWSDRRKYAEPPPIHIYVGPQWDTFSIDDRRRLTTEAWKISPVSDRVGYRLQGPPLKAHPPEIVSEAVRLGSIQVPENGQPIITMPDGPTVGGYPKIALVDERDLPWIAQSRPGQTIRFELVS